VARKVDITWSSPVLVHTKDRTEVVTAAAEAIIAEHVAAFQEVLSRGVQRSKTKVLHPSIGEASSLGGAA